MNDIPHSPEAEAGALGCVLLDGSLAPSLRSEWFHDIRHKALAGCLLAMAGGGSPIDVATTAAALTKAGRAEDAGGLVYLAELPDKAPSAGNFAHWRAILDEFTCRRKIISTCAMHLERARASDIEPADLVDAFERDALSVRRNRAGAEPSMREILLGVIEDMEAVRDGKRKIGLPSGFPDVDALTKGFRPGSLNIVAARPACGKTSLALCIALHAAIDLHVPAAFLSCEMTVRELGFRMLGIRSRLPISLIEEGRFNPRDQDRLSLATAKIASAPLTVREVPGLTAPQLIATARRLKQASGIGLLMVDYLQLLRSGQKGRSRYEDCTEVSATCKRIAIELGIPLIVLAQLNRDSERNDRPPRMSDLRDSGAIEQDADFIGIIDPQRSETDAPDTPVVCRLAIAKNRHGPAGSVRLLFEPKYCAFTSLAPERATLREAA